MKCQLWNDHTGKLEEGGASLLQTWREGERNIIWIHIDGELHNEHEEFLVEEFCLHPLALQDAKRDRHPPKFENFKEAAFLIFKALAKDSGDIDFRSEQLAIFMGDRFLITRSSGPILCIEEFRGKVRLDPTKLSAGAAEAMMRMVRILIDDFLAILLELEPKLESLESGLLERRKGEEALAKLTMYKSDLKRLRRTLLYHELLIDRMRIDEELTFSDELMHRLNDLFEQQERSNSLALLYYEFCSDLIDGYLSMSAHKLNEIMKVLTIVSTVFIPLGFLAGLYGMNFEFMPELKFKWGYYTLLGVMALTAVVLLVIFRIKKWIG